MTNIITISDNLRSVISKFYTQRVEIFCFGVSGGIAAVADWVALYLLTDIVRIWYIPSSVIAFIFSLAVGFVLQKYWTFSDYSEDKTRVQALSYSAIAVVNLALNTALVYSLVEFEKIHYMLAQIIVTLVLAAASYYVYKVFVFKRLGLSS